MFREREDSVNNPFSRIIEYLVDDTVIGYLKYSLIY